MTSYSKDNDYTLIATSKLPSGATLHRIFNFAAEEVTTVVRDFVERKEKIEKSTHASGGGNAVSTSVAVGLAIDTKTKNFSEFDSQAEIELMRRQLIEQGGTPPEKGLENKPKPAQGGLQQIGA